MRLFKRVLNLAPATYQRQRRLEEADRLLRSDQGRSIEDVAYLVGYESVSAFCRSYRRMFGKSPAGKDWSFANSFRLSTNRLPTKPFMTSALVT